MAKIDDVLEKMGEELKVFGHYCLMRTERQKVCYVWYCINMNSYLLHLDWYYSRRMALHFLKEYKREVQRLGM